MIKFILAAVLGTSAQPAGAFNHHAETARLQAVLKSEDPVRFAAQADRAVAAMIRLAGIELRERGMTRQAAELETSFAANAEGYLTAAMIAEDLGDHAPYSQWLSDTYVFLEVLLGETVMRFLHLDDIKIINYGVVVVLHLDGVGSDIIDAAEYELHFVPFAGVLSYWSVWIACEVATWGTGMVFVCTPAGIIAEHVMYNRIAPKFAPRFFERMY